MNTSWACCSSHKTLVSLETQISLKKSLERVYSSLPLAPVHNAAVLDIGSGGGLPGLVIAHDRPDVHVTLIDRREKRTDLLQRQALAFADINLDFLLM